MVRVQVCVSCQGTGKDPLYAVPIPCPVCLGRGGYRTEWEGDTFRYEPVDPRQIDLVDELK